MKKILMSWWIAIIIIAILGCSEPQPRAYDYKFNYINNTTHTIVLNTNRHTNKQFYTITQEDTLEYMTTILSDDYIILNDSIIVFYDSTKYETFYCTSINYPTAKERSVYLLKNYVTKTESGETKYYYTITEQDYIEADTILK